PAVPSTAPSRVSAATTASRPFTSLTPAVAMANPPARHLDTAILYLIYIDCKSQHLVEWIGLQAWHRAGEVLRGGACAKPPLLRLRGSTSAHALEEGATMSSEGQRRAEHR